VHQRTDIHASIAERFAFGTPIDPAVDDVAIHSVPRSGTALFGRILLAAIFITSGFAKLSDPAGAVGYMNAVGIPNADVLVYVAGAAELLGGLSLLVGFLARLGALGLVLVMVPIQFYFHSFWNMEGAEAKTQMVQFMKNLAIMGGLLMVGSQGPGRYSIDAKLRRPLLP
jgi:putative oxidoreductase